jgi:predicted Rossmann fold nucleotide-binding protein DprA/Smf involved in DNA uptake
VRWNFVLKLICEISRCVFNLNQKYFGKAKTLENIAFSRVFAWLPLLGSEPPFADEDCADSNMPAGAVLAVLTMLEVKGILKRLPGKRVELK